MDLNVQQMEKLFDSKFIEKIELIKEVQRNLFDNNKLVLETNPEILNIVLRLLQAIQTRPKSFESMLRICLSLEGFSPEKHILPILNDSLAPEQQLFCKTILEQVESGEFEELGASLENSDFCDNFNSYELSIINDDVEQLSKALETISVDSQVSPTLRNSNDLLRHRPNLVQLTAFFGSWKCFQLLSERGAVLDMKDQMGHNLFDFAVAGGNEEIIRISKEKKLDTSREFEISVQFHRNGFLRTVPKGLKLLHKAAASNNVEVFTHCLVNGEKVNDLDAHGQAAIHIAIRHRSLDVLEVLLNCKQLNVNIKETNEGQTALHLAVQDRLLEPVLLLLNHPMINQRISNKRGQLALHVAAELGHNSIIDALIHHGGVTVNSRTDYGSTALNIAVSSGQLETVEHLLENEDLDIEAKTFADETVLHCAARGTSVECLQLILAHGLKDLNPHDRDGWTPLHEAFNSIEVFQTLFSWPGVDPNSTSKSGWTALHKAAAMNAQDFIALLLSRPDTRVNEQDRDGWTPLHVAAKDNSVNAVRLLMEHDSIDVNKQNQAGWTPLHIALKYQHYEIIALLLSSPAIDINKITTEGWTAIHIAFLYHDIASKELLMGRPECNLELKDSMGRTPEELGLIPLFSGNDGEDI